MGGWSATIGVSPSGNAGASLVERKAAVRGSRLVLAATSLSNGSVSAGAAGSLGFSARGLGLAGALANKFALCRRPICCVMVGPAMTAARRTPAPRRYGHSLLNILPISALSRDKPEQPVVGQDDEQEDVPVSVFMSYIFSRKAKDAGWVYDAGCHERPKGQLVPRLEVVSPEQWAEAKGCSQPRYCQPERFPWLSLSRTTHHLSIMSASSLCLNFLFSPLS